MVRSNVCVCVILVMSTIFIGIEGNWPHISSKHPSRPVVQTVKSANGDIFDCVDIQKQPAFDHPAMKDHVIQMRPSISREESNTNARSGPARLHFSKMAESCPDGTVPVHRLPTKKLQRAPTLRHLEADDPEHAFPNARRSYEIAVAMEVANRLYGTQARINCWEPKLEFSKDYSSSQIWVRKGSVQPVNSIEAGVIVHPTIFNDNVTRLFVYWTKDVLGNNGCYNLQCPGFVQVDKSVLLGGVIGVLSVYGGVQHDLSFQIFQDLKTAHWWLRFEGTNVGYWPSTLFQAQGLPAGADRIGWGGLIYSPDQEGKKSHTGTQMGSGHFSLEGYGKASYVSNIKVDADTNYTRDPAAVYNLVARPTCYDLSVSTNLGTQLKYHLFYGGPGRNENCQ